MEFENQGVKNRNRIILVFYVGTSAFELPNQSKWLASGVSRILQLKACKWFYDINVWFYWDRNAIEYTYLLSLHSFNFHFNYVYYT